MKLHNFYSSPYINYYDKSRRMRWVERMACMGDMRNRDTILVKIPEKKRSLRRLSH